MPGTLLVIYFSNTGTTKKMAMEIVRGAQDAGATVTAKSVVDCTVEDLVGVDAFAFGSPTHYGNIAWQSKRFLDETVLAFYSQRHSLKGKVCGCFTSTGGYADGKECLRMLELAFGSALKMKMVPGVVLESADVAHGDISKCYELGQKIGQQLACKQ